MSINFVKLPLMDPVGPHRKWVVISDANEFSLNDDNRDILGYSMVHYTQPIPNVVLGIRTERNEWIISVQGFNDGDDPKVADPIGTFGYIHTWPAVKPVYRKGRDFLLICDEVHESDYENAKAFETFPICPFYTMEDLVRVDSFYEVRQSSRSATLHL